MNLLSLKNLVSLEAVNDVSYMAHSKTDSYSHCQELFSYMLLPYS